MAQPVTILPDASPYDLEKMMLRDGRPRDVLNQRIRVNDTVRVWTVQTGWSSGREYFVRHILPIWTPGTLSPQEQAAISFSPTPQLPKGKTSFAFLLAPQQDEVGQTSDPAYIGDDSLQIYRNTTLIITAQDFLVITEGMAEERIKVFVNDYEAVKIRAGEAGVIYNSDAGEGM